LRPSSSETRGAHGPTKQGASEAVRKNIKISDEESLGYVELKGHKPWFGEETRKQAKL
jgi:hypothetical protein